MTTTQAPTAPALQDGDTFVLNLRTTRHYAQYDGAQVVCLCGKTSDTPDGLARKHTRSGKAIPAAYAYDGWSVSTGGAGGTVTVSIPTDRDPRHGDALGVLGLVLGTADAARLAGDRSGPRRVGDSTVFTFKVRSPQS